MRVLVLGGTGFIGSYIAEHLSDHGHDVMVYGRSFDKLVKQSKIEYYQGDFSDSLQLSEALHGVDVVIHSISSTVPSTSNLDPLADIQQNLVNTVRLLQLMMQAKVTRLVYLSSGGTVYGKPNFLPVAESHPLNPICSYGVIKLAIENYIYMFKELYGLQPIVIRPSNPYGPRQSHSGVQGALTTFLMNNVLDKKTYIWGDGETRRGYIYIKDLAEFCRLAVESDVEGTFNVCSGVSTSLNELVVLIDGITGMKSKVEYKPKRDFDVKDIVLDISQAQSKFGWVPKYTVEAGIAEFYQAIK